jgi:hypothetical protein
VAVRLEVHFLPLKATIAIACRALHFLPPTFFRELIMLHPLNMVMVALTSRPTNGTGLLFIRTGNGEYSPFDKKNKKLRSTMLTSRKQDRANDQTETNNDNH